MRVVCFCLFLFAFTCFLVFSHQTALSESLTPLPLSAIIEGFEGKAQTYALSCESRAAADVAAFWGVTINEKQVLAELPISDDPNLGFVGDVNGKWGSIPPNDYGVHAEPIAAVLRNHGLQAVAVSNFSLDGVKMEIAHGRPVIVWVVGIVWNGIPQQYHTSEGKLVTVAAFEHTMIALGYNEQQILLVNTGDGNAAFYDMNNFSASWQVLENMAVIVKGRIGDHNAENPYLLLTAMPTAPNFIEITPVLNPITTPQVEIIPTFHPSFVWQYTVIFGETLEILAERWNIPLERLAEYNQLKPPYNITGGQVLFVPFQSELVSTTNVTVPLNNPTTEQNSKNKLLPQQRFYVVQQGDYLSKLAKEWGITWQQIAELNRLQYPYAIYAGQTLIMP